MIKLHEAIATLKGIKARVAARCTELHRILQKPELLSGLERHYKSRFDDGDKLPSESKRVQAKSEDLLEEMGSLTAEMIDAVARVDYTNCSAIASIEVDGETVATNVPATHLIFLEKQLVDLHTSLSKAVTHDEADVWKEDTSTPNLWRTNTVETARTKKVEKPLVLFAATVEHPAQTKTIIEDIIEGYWSNTKLSGAIPASRQKNMLARIDKLIDAVRSARERANGVEVTAPAIGQRLMDFVLHD